jgi:hypothetical protein
MDLQEACKSSDPGAIRQWAARWLQKLAAKHGRAHWPTVQRRENEPEDIERRWSKVKATTPQIARCSLAGVQFYIAREHGFTSWPEFAQHVAEMARANSPVSAFEAAADAIVDGDIERLKKLLADHPGLVRERSKREHRSTLLRYVSANGVENFRQKMDRSFCMSGVFPKAS